jgi:hypothetical protein
VRSEEERGCAGSWGEGAYGDDVAVAPGEDVTAAEDGPHRVHELADVRVHAAALPFFFPSLFHGFSRGGLIRGRAVRVLYGVSFGVAEEWAEVALWAKQRKEAVSELKHRIIVAVWRNLTRCRWRLEKPSYDRNIDYALIRRNSYGGVKVLTILYCSANVNFLQYIKCHRNWLFFIL